MNAWTEKLNDNPIDWLLKSNAWTKYKTYTDLLGFEESKAETIDSKAELLSDKRIIALVEETKDWLIASATRNNDPKITYFKLKALAEFGLKHTDLELYKTVDKASEHIIENMFGVRGQTPERPKKGEKYEKPDLEADVWHISPCNSPLITTALIELGVKNELVNNSIAVLKDKWTNMKDGFAIFSSLIVSLKN